MARAQKRSPTAPKQRGHNLEDGLDSEDSLGLPTPFDATSPPLRRNPATEPARRFTAISGPRKSRRLESTGSNSDGEIGSGNPPPSRTKPDRNGMASPPPRQLAEGSAANPVLTPINNSIEPSSGPKLKAKPKVVPSPRMASVPRPTLRGRLRSTAPHPDPPPSKSSSSIWYPCPHECECKYTSMKPSHIKRHVATRHPACTPACSYHHVTVQGNDSVETNETSISSNTQQPPLDSPNPTQPKKPGKITSRPAGRSTPREKVVQKGPPELVDATNPPNPTVVATVQGAPQVVEPVPNQNGASVEPGNRPNGSPAKSPPAQSTQSSIESNIESLYASPVPEKTGAELMPIELDSDPDFDMMERMLFSHRGLSSQSQSIKKEPAAQPQASSQAKRPLKRQRSNPSPNESSQAPTQTPQGGSKPAKRPRVTGPRSSDSVVLNDRRKHPEFWDLDGTVVLQVDDILFRVMRSSLSKASPWFRRLFSEELDHPEIMAGCPIYIIEEDLSHFDFANLLRGLEDGLEYALSPPHYLRIVSIFRAASLLEFDTLRRWSLGCLERQWPADLPPPSKPSKFGNKIPWAEETLMIADRLDVPQLVKRTYWELCTRSEFGRIDAEGYDNDVEEITVARPRLPRSVLMDLTRVRERLLPEWTRITRTPPVDVPCTRVTKTPSTSTSTIQPTPCSLDYTNWYKVISGVEVNDMTIDDRRADPISALEVMIVEIDWEQEGGFCADCVKTWKMIWTKDREKIWRNLGDWLGLDIATEP